MKEKIKEWLKSSSRDRDWLAEQIGVNKRTVDNWLSSPKEIPVGKLKLIERLIEDDEAAEAQRLQKLQPSAQLFSVEVDLPTFRVYSAAALAAGKTLEQWAIAELNAVAEASMNELPKEQAPQQSSKHPGADSQPPVKGANSSSPIIKLPPQHIEEPRSDSRQSS